MVFILHEAHFVLDGLDEGRLVFLLLVNHFQLLAKQNTPGLHPTSASAGASTFFNTQ